MSLILCLLMLFSPEEKKKELVALPLPYDTLTNTLCIEQTIQLAHKINIDSTLDTISQAEVYLRSLNWFELHFPSPKKVIQNYSQPDSVTGKYKFRIYYINPKTEVRNIIKYWIVYDIKFECFNGQYKYIIDNFRTDEATPQKIERWLTNDGKPKKEYIMYTNQLVEYLKELEKSIIEKMKLSPSK